MAMKKSLVEKFLYWIRERHSIHNKRNNLESPPWSSDPVFQTEFFTNPWREDDKTTIWFRENIREPLRNDPVVMIATVLFRWFNLISTGEQFLQYDKQVKAPCPVCTHPNYRKSTFCQPPSRKRTKEAPCPVCKGTQVRTDLPLFRSKRMPKKSMLSRLNEVQNRGNQVFTGAYIIKAENNRPKIESVLDCVHTIWSQQDKVLAVLEGEPPCEYSKMFPYLLCPGCDYRTRHSVEFDHPHPRANRKKYQCEECGHTRNGGNCTMQRAHEYFSKFAYLGGFMAYEIVCDLRHTYLLENAPDLLTWCHLGPGAIRGLRRLLGEDPGPKGQLPPKNWQPLMTHLLMRVQQEHERPVEMREIEHSLCEFDKYQRAQENGKMKRKFDPTKSFKVQQLRSQ